MQLFVGGSNPMIAFTVFGTPAPQGSKRHVGNGVMVESSLRVEPWREAVKTAALKAREGAASLTGPVNVTFHFYFRRPKGHYGTGRNAGVVKDSAPAFPSGRPDLDKCCRLVADSLTDSGLIRDDAQIVQLTAWKDYTNTTQDTPGVFITVNQPKEQT